MRSSFLVPEVLETERLRLRLPEAADFAAYAAMLADPEVHRFVGGGQLADPAIAFRALGFQIGHWHLLGYGPWLVEERATGRLAGRVGGFFPQGWPACEILWTLARDFWGRGYATEAALAARQAVRDALGDVRLVSLVVPENGRSARLALRLGCRPAEATVIAGTACRVFEHPSRDQECGGESV